MNKIIYCIMILFFVYVDSNNICKYVFAKEIQF